MTPRNAMYSSPGLVLVELVLASAYDFFHLVDVFKFEAFDLGDVLETDFG